MRALSGPLASPSLFRSVPVGRVTPGRLALVDTGVGGTLPANAPNGAETDVVRATVGGFVLAGALS